MRCISRRLISALVALASLTGTAHAAGFILYELGTPDVGLASAGYAARAQDASTVFTNPAGMTLLDHSQMLMGVQPIYGRLQFEPSNRTTTSGTDGGNALVPLPGGSGFYVHSLSPKLKLGIGGFAYFGGALEYNLDWVGRYFLQGSTILGFSIMPAVAYRVNDWLSVGGGLNVMIGVLKSKVGVNNLRPDLPDGRMKIQDYTVGVGGNIGVLLEPLDGTRIGVTYLTPVELNFSDVPHFSGLGPGLIRAFKRRGLFGADVDLGLEVPQSVMVSGYQRLTDKLALLGNVGWQNWSQFGQVQIGVGSADPKNLTANLKYQDTFHIAIGTQYQAFEKWLLSAGFAFDNSMVSDAARTVTAPVGNQYRYGFGAQYDWSESVKLGMAYEFQWQGDLSLSQGAGPVRGTVAGEFSDVFVNFFAFNMIWKF
jgi:long-chain fatty acid transport protein